MEKHLARALAVALPLALAPALDACGPRSSNSAPDATARDVAPDAPPTRVGLACAGDVDCPGLTCATRYERMCQGPIRPHTWSLDFPGGVCHPPVDLARGDIPGGCPPGTRTLTAYVGCDGIPTRICLRVCASDADCRAAEGYRCNREAMLCYPPALVTEEPDAGAD